MPLRFADDLFGTGILDWRMLPDIALLAAVFFLLYRTLRSMGTLKIALGMGSAALLFFLASFLGLRGVEWLLSNFSQVALIGLIVLFQPEIRKILERATPLRRRGRGEPLGRIPDIVDEVLFALAERRWGALVVLPGNDSVQAWAPGGIEAGAIPSFALLMSIFDPDSPGHDGAVILEDGKISKFGVRLPLSSTHRLSDRFGTRHHAAMGMSESTDALIFAVSEERGTVTAFHTGTPQAFREKGEIADRIHKHGTEPRTAQPLQRGKGRRWIRPIEVGLSLLVAATFWFFVVTRQAETEDVFLSIPIEYAGLPTSLSLEPGHPDQARVRLSGKASAVRSARLVSIRMIIDVSQAVPGHQRIAVDEDNVPLPRDLKLISVDPEVIDLQFTSVEIRMVNIKPQLVGILPEGLKLASVQITPATAEVLVSKDLKQEKGFSILTSPIYLPAIREDTSVIAKLVAPPGVAPADKRWPDVEVKVRVQAGDMGSPADSGKALR